MAERVVFYDFLPSSLRDDPVIKAAAEAVDKEMAKTESYIKNVIIIPRIEEQPEEVLDALAIHFHVDFYEPVTLTLEQKRIMVKNSLDWHTRKGTPSAVEEVVSAVFSGAVTEEWFEYGGLPYYFKVTADMDTEQLVDDDTLVLLTQAITVMKNTRSWLELIYLLRQRDFHHYHAMGVHHKQELNVDSEYFNGEDVEVDDGPWYFCGAVPQIDNSPIEMGDYSGGVTATVSVENGPHYSCVAAHMVVTLPILMEVY